MHPGAISILIQNWHGKQHDYLLFNKAVTMFAPVRNNNEPEKVYLFESEFESDLKKASNHQ